MTAPLSHVIDTDLGRAGRVNPRWVRAARPDVVDLWLMTFGKDRRRWQATLHITAIPDTGQMLRLHTHHLTVAAVDGPLCTPLELLDRGIPTRPDEIYMHALHLRQGAPQGWRLAHLLVGKIMDGEIVPIPTGRNDRASWRLALGVGISACLQPDTARPDLSLVPADDSE
jgi:hypothetical protein